MCSFLRILGLSFMIQPCYFAVNNREDDDFDQPASESNEPLNEQLQQKNLDTRNDPIPSTSYNYHCHENNPVINGSYQITRLPDQYTKMTIDVPVPGFISSCRRSFNIYRRIIQCGGCHSLVIGRISRITPSQIFVLYIRRLLQVQRGSVPIGLMTRDWPFSSITRNCPKCYKTLDVYTDLINDGIVYQRCIDCLNLRDMWSCKFKVANKCLEAICDSCYNRRLYNGRTLRHQIKILCKPLE